MRNPTLAAALVLLAAPAAAQTSTGWEIRAGLSSASASVCDTGGACFGLTCSAAGGWRPVWFTEVVPQGEAAPSDPILAIRTDSGRFALTGLSAVPSDGPAARYEGAVAAADDALLTALQAGEALEVDPGREFALASFDLRGSRWAMSTALDLCSDGGPDIGNTETAAEG